ncbi:MAG: MopE-related protein [Anaeromyxobacter sp.]
MTSRRPFPRRRLLAGLVPLLLVAAALPLMAPTCGGGAEGWRTFQRNSLIIPMDRCWQNQTDAVTPGTVANCSSPQTGDVIRAYGLVYQLIRNNVAVYWVISPDKAALTGQDLAVQYSGGFPVLKYDWTAGAPGAGLGADHTIRYLGGPFIVDGSDYDKAVAVLARYRTSFSAVNVHVSNVAFRGYVKKTMAGGWNAGGTVPPKLALLDIGSGNISSLSPLAIRDPKNAEPVISGYLNRAGIGSGTAAGTATGTHGEIYDRLTIDDFQPASGSTDPTTSRLFTNGYQILWVPHWVAPGSCSNYSSTTNCANSKYSDARIAQTLQTIGAFVASGKDVFAECAGMGSFEGAFKRGNAGTSDSAYTIDYQKGDPSTRFQTLNGLRYNELPNNPFPAPTFPGNFSSPLLQLGDFPFSPYTGAIEDYRPQNPTSGGGYHADVTRLIRGTAGGANTSYGDPYDAWDYFTIRPSASGRGTIVYLAGHSYSGVQGTFQVAGSRLVLNTLFNLGAGCTDSGVTCDTGKLGVCAKGTLACSQSGASVCTQSVFPSAETCNGLDDDCDGLVDEDLEVGCYDGPAATRNVGLCRQGVSACERKTDGSYGMSACVGQVLPADEVCNGLDDNCNATVDEALQQACYFGPLSSLDDQGRPQGACKAGTQTCSQGTWGECAVCPAGIQPSDPGYAACQILPAGETCQDTTDVDCNGYVKELAGECGSCTPGATATCYTGPGGTVNVGLCHAGTQTCSSSGSWGPCVGEVKPVSENLHRHRRHAARRGLRPRARRGLRLPRRRHRVLLHRPDRHRGQRHLRRRPPHLRQRPVRRGLRGAGAAHPRDLQRQGRRLRRRRRRRRHLRLGLLLRARRLRAQLLRRGERLPGGLRLQGPVRRQRRDLRARQLRRHHLRRRQGVPVRQLRGPLRQRHLRRRRHLRLRRLRGRQLLLRGLPGRPAVPQRQLRRRRVRRRDLPLRHLLPRGRLRAGLHLRQLPQRREVRHGRLLRVRPVRQPDLRPDPDLRGRDVRRGPVPGPRLRPGPGLQGRRVR